MTVTKSEISSFLIATGDSFRVSAPVRYLEDGEPTSTYGLYLPAGGEYTHRTAPGAISLIAVDEPAELTRG